MVVRLACKCDRLVVLILMNCDNRYLLENMDWLEEEIGDYDNDYLIFDCPGKVYLI